MSLRLLALCFFGACLVSTNAIEAGLMRHEGDAARGSPTISKKEVDQIDGAASELEDDEEDASGDDLTREEREALDEQSEEEEKHKDGSGFFDDITGEDEDGAHPDDSVDDDAESSFLETDEGEEGEDEDEHEDEDEGEDGEKGELLEQEEMDEDDGQDDEREEDGEWSNEIHYMPESRINELMEIKKNGKDLSVDALLDKLADDNWTGFSDNETMVPVKMIEDNHDKLSLAEFVEKKTVKGFIDLVLQGRLAVNATEAKPMTFAEFKKSEHYEKEGDQEEDDVYMLPGSAFDALVDMYNKKKESVTKDEITSLISEEHIESLPDTENVVAFKIAFASEDLPDLLNSTTPQAFLEKVIAGQKALPHPKNISLGQLRKFQHAADKESELEDDEEDEHEDGDEGASAEQEEGHEEEDHDDSDHDGKKGKDKQEDNEDEQRRKAAEGGK